MDFKQIVNFRMVKQEASLLYQSLTPLIELDEKFADLILVDLAKVVQICGQASGEVTSGELLAYLILYSLVKKDKEKLNIALNTWEFSEADRTQYQKITLQIILDYTKTQSSADLVLPSILNKLDEEKRSNYLDQAVNAIYKFAQVIVKADGDVSMQEMEALSRIWQMLHAYRSLDSYQAGLNAASSTIQAPSAAPTSSSSSAPAPAAAAPDVPPSPEATPKSEAELEQILEQAMSELNDLVGLDNIKEEVKTLANFLKVQKIRMERGLAQTTVSLHAVFCGPPGTGKTTIARLMSRIYQGLGFLKKGHLVETDRSGMVAGYIGQTAKRVDELVNSALDGVLFIDEAYALVPKDTSRDFGQEAIDILLKRMEDYRDRLVIIVAGYTDEMTTFIESNPGLKSRFNRYFYFNDYEPQELLAIFEKMAGKSHFKLTAEAQAKLLRLFEELYVRRDRTFGNARVARNLFEKSIERQANRLAVLSAFTDEILTTLLPEDIPMEAVNTLSGAMNWQELASPKADPVPDQSPNSTDWADTSSVNEIRDRLMHVLGSQDVTVKVTRSDSRLGILLESDPVLEESTTVTQIKEALRQLPLNPIQQITLYGREPGEEIPVWSEEFDL
ncbi:MAG: hypothetical protein Kow00121_53020 [Elainellaceae cyanobacterium]